jgi:DNA helicase-2/ATP-dependent DNA helicase PcrA
MQPELQTAIEKLSPEQREIVEWNDGALLVLAGPGSGKTQVLTLRIARLLAASPEKKFRILGLTFTNKAADEMRERVGMFVPQLAHRSTLTTFHSFCADVLRLHGTHVGVKPNFKIYRDDADLLAILQDACLGAGPPLQRSALSDLLKTIQRLQAYLHSPEQCSDAFGSNRERAEYVQPRYAAYQGELIKRNALDFGSLLMLCYELLAKQPAVAKHYRIVYPYICVDEFQDANLAQYRILTALIGESHRNVFVVADDDQIIYRWNGASYERLKRFENDHKPERKQLETVFRCPPEVVEIANRLIRHNSQRANDKKPLASGRESLPDEEVRFLPVFETFENEAQGVSQDIKRRYADRLDSVAVLARRNTLLEKVQASLETEEIRGVILRRKDEFESTPFVWLHSILRLSNDGRNQKSLEAVCGSFAQLTQMKVNAEEVAMSAEAANHGYLREWVKMTRELPRENPEVIENVQKFLVEVRDFRGFIRFALEWFNKSVVQSSEDNEIFAGYEDERKAWLDIQSKITQTLGNDLSLEAFLQELEMRSKESPPCCDAVSLMTIHGAKGKEFDHVYLIGCVEDELPSFQSIKQGTKSPEMEEERRNCFVAVTRAKKTLTLSFAKRYFGWEKKPSRFLCEMGLMEAPKP